MTFLVNPGFGGQSNLPSMIKKILRTRKMIDQSDYDIFLEIDGGISSENIERLAEKGANAFVAGSAIFSKADRKAEISLMRELAERGYQVLRGKKLTKTMTLIKISEPGHYFQV